MDTARIIRFSEPPTNGRGGPLVYGSFGSGHLSTGIGHFEPGRSVALHVHNCDESVSIIEGEAVCEVNGQTYELQTFDTTFIPEGVPHRFMNKSGRSMKILWIYASGYVTMTYLETGETQVHSGSRASP